MKQKSESFWEMCPFDDVTEHWVGDLSKWVGEKEFNPHKERLKVCAGEVDGED